MAITDAQLQAALPYFGVTQEEIRAVQMKPTFEEAVAALDDLKKRVKKNYKQAVRALHPDVTGNDPAKTEIFRTLTEMVDGFEQLQVRRPPPPRPVFQTWSNSTASTSTVTTGFGGVTIRIVF